MTLSPGDRVEVSTGRSFERGTVSSDRPPESGYPSERSDSVWVEFDSLAGGYRAAWVHIEDCRKLGLLELIAEAAQ